jgi:hypothetical protein
VGWRLAQWSIPAVQALLGLYQRARLGSSSTPHPSDQPTTETHLEGGREAAALSVTRSALDERPPLEWHRGEDDLGPYDAVVLSVGGEVLWAIVAFDEVPRPSLIVLAEDGATRESFQALLSALAVAEDEVLDVADELVPRGSIRRSWSRSDFVEQVARKSDASKRRPLWRSTRFSARSKTRWPAVTMSRFRDSAGSMSRSPDGSRAATPGVRRSWGVARETPTESTRMVAVLVARDLGRAVNRKRVQRLMREHALA